MHTAALPEFSQMALSAQGPVEHGSKRQLVYGSPEYPLGHLQIEIIQIYKMFSLGLLYYNTIFNPITTQENYLANSCSSIGFAFRIGTAGPGGAWLNLAAPSLVKWISSIAYGIIKFFEK